MNLYRMTLNLTNGNCLEEMKKIADKSIDLMICDLPYGETNCKWDIKIDMDVFWDEFKRIRKSKRTACIHFCSTKFGYQLIKSWEKGYKMDMVWKKRNKTGGLQSRHRPMRNHEMVYFFYEQAPLYNRDKYHKRIVAKQKTEKSETAIFGVETECKSNFGGIKNITFDPINPVSILEEDAPLRKSIKDRKGVDLNNVYTSDHNKEWLKKNKGFTPRQPVSILEEDPRVDAKGKSAHGYDIEFMDKPRVPHFDPKLPASVLEEDGEGKYKVDDKVWGWETNKLDKSMRGKEGFDPKLPVSVLEEDNIKKEDYYLDNDGNHTGTHSNKAWKGTEVKMTKNTTFGALYEPQNPVSILEEQPDVYGETKKKRIVRRKKGDSNFLPPNPASVLEEDSNKNSKYIQQTPNSKGFGYEYGSGIQQDKKGKDRFPLTYDPPNPASVLVETEEFDPWGMPNSGKKGSGNVYVPPNPASVLVEKESTEFVYPPDKFHGKSYKEKYGCNPTCYEPHNPVSILEYDEDEPMSMFESKKVFIGKRHHQTEKPIDILEFFLKYWTNDGDTILDPTMGSGSTGVACQKIGSRNFIGFELNEDIFKVAKSRMNILD